jgi:hypothetical protein
MLYKILLKNVLSIRLLELLLSEDINDTIISSESEHAGHQQGLHKLIVQMGTQLPARYYYIHQWHSYNIGGTLALALEHICTATFQSFSPLIWADEV